MFLAATLKRFESKPVWRTVCLALLVASLSAQATDEVVIVTGTRIPTPLERLGGAATVITERDIRLHQYRGITDVLSGVPGMHVASSGGSGAQTSVFLHGAESDHVQVLIDGVEVTPAGGGVFGFEHLQLNGIERIEVLRGPYSSQYGSEGIGGVINIVTKRGTRVPEMSARVETGSFETDAASINLSGQRGRVDFSLSGAWLQSEGESFTPRRLRGNRAEEDDGYDNRDVKGTVGIETGGTSRVDLNFGHMSVDVEYDGDSPGDFERAGLSSSRYEKRYGARWSGEYLQGLWRPSLQGGYYSGRSDDIGSEKRGERVKFEWSNSLFLSDAVKFVAGSETELEKSRSTQGAMHASARTNGVYLQAWFEPFDSLSLSGGWRNDDLDDFGSDRNWQVAAVYAPGGSSLRLRASYGTAFKAPSLSDRFASFPDSNFRSNPDLGPETSRSRGFGIGQTLAPGGDWLVLEWGLTYFDSRIRNLIAVSSDFSTLQNIDFSHTEGIESFVLFETATGLDLRLNYTAMRARDGEHRRLLRRPVRKAGFTAHWENPTWLFAAGLDYIGPQRDIRRDTFERVTKGGYALARVSVRRHFSDTVVLFARVNNVFDKEYEPVDGFAGRGFEFHAGVETRLQL